MAYIVAADEIKKTLPGYRPARSEDFHKVSARLADKEFDRALNARPEKTVILMAGGAASGKSEYVSVYLKRRKVIVLDGTMPSLEGATIKIKKVLKANKKVEIHFVMPESLLVAYVVFLNRERQFSPEHFFRTHSSSRKTILQITETFPDVPIKIFESYVKVVELPAPDQGSMKFRELQYGSHTLVIEFLKKNQYTKEQLTKVIFDR